MKSNSKKPIKTLRFCHSTVESLPHQGSLQSLLHHVYLGPTKPMFMKPHSSWMSRNISISSSKKRNISIRFSRKLGSVPFSLPHGMFLRQVFYKISSRINFALAFSKQAAISKVKSDHWSWLQLLLQNNTCEIFQSNGPFHPSFSRFCMQSVQKPPIAIPEQVALRYLNLYSIIIVK